MSFKFVSRVGVAMVLGLAASTGCQGQRALAELPAEAAAAEAGPGLAVEALTLTEEDASAPVFAHGTSRAARDARLAPSMTARIERIFVTPGQRVKRGAPLVQLESEPIRLGAAQAAAAAAAARVQAQQLATDFERLAPLGEEGTLASGRLVQLASQRDAAKAQVEAAEAAAAVASRYVANATLRAPFDGVVVDVPVEVGEIASVTPATIMVHLMDLSAVEVHVRVHERDLPRIAVGDRAVARFESLGVEVEGEISEAGLDVDPATRTARVVARLENPDGRLLSGAFAELAVHPARKSKMLLVPQRLVAGDGALSYCWVIEGDKVRRRTVEVAPFGGGRVELRSGVAPGERLAAAGLERLSEGQVVAVVAPGEARDSADAAPALRGPAESVKGN